MQQLCTNLLHFYVSYKPFTPEVPVRTEAKQTASLCGHFIPQKDNPLLKTAIKLAANNECVSQKQTSESMPVLMLAYAMTLCFAAPVNNTDTLHRHLRQKNSLRAVMVKACVLLQSNSADYSEQ